MIALMFNSGASQLDEVRFLATAPDHPGQYGENDLFRLLHFHAKRRMITNSNSTPVNLLCPNPSPEPGGPAQPPGFLFNSSDRRSFKAQTSSQLCRLSFALIQRIGIRGEH